MNNIQIADYDAVIKWSYTLAKHWAIEKLVPEGVTSARKFEQYKRDGKYLPRNFPRLPDEYFKRRGSWKGWRDFLGHPAQNRKKPFLTYRDAARIVRLAGIRNCKDYRDWKNRPSNLPARPDLTYEEWQNWEQFLGNSYVKPPNTKGGAKLKEMDVRIIKHQLNMGIPGAILAREFGVSEMQISRIKKGENWTEV